MPSLEAIAACRAAGFDPDQPFTFTRWQQIETNPGVTVDFVTQGGIHKAVRIANAATGRVFSKIPNDDSTDPDDGTVDATFDDVMFLPVNKAKVLKNIQDNFPSVDLDKIVFTRQGGKVIADLSAFTSAQQTATKAKLLLTNFADKITLLP